MRSVVVAFIVVLASASVTEAGAWLREKGKGFVATSLGTDKDRDTSFSGYFEYGIAENRTLGLDISYGLEQTLRDEGSGIAFIRFPLGPTDQTHRFAWHAGIGTRYLNREFYPAAELGISWGRGIKLGERWGWANIDASVNESQSPIETRIKIDGTFGIPFHDNIKGMAQVFNTFEDGETYTRLAPSLLLVAGRKKTTLQLSAEIPTIGGGDTIFKIGIWSNF